MHQSVYRQSLWFYKYKICTSMQTDSRWISHIRNLLRIFYFTSILELEEQSARIQVGQKKGFPDGHHRRFYCQKHFTYTSDKNFCSERFAKIRETLQSKDVQEPIVINYFIQVNKRTMFMTIIKHIIERGAPFDLKDYSFNYSTLSYLHSAPTSCSILVTLLKFNSAKLTHM